MDLIALLWYEFRVNVRDQRFIYAVPLMKHGLRKSTIWYPIPYYPLMFFVYTFRDTILEQEKLHFQGGKHFLILLFRFCYLFLLLAGSIYITYNRLTPALLIYTDHTACREVQKLPYYLHTPRTSLGLRYLLVVHCELLWYCSVRLPKYNTKVISCYTDTSDWSTYYRTLHCTKNRTFLNEKLSSDWFLYNFHTTDKNNTSRFNVTFLLHSYSFNYFKEFI